MSSPLGNEVLVGLLAGPEDFRRLRAARRQGEMGRLWRAFAHRLEQGNAHAADLAFAAAVTGRADFAQRAINGALEIAHQPHWVHLEAGCMTLTGMHHAHTLCQVVDWVWPLLLRDQREALLGALVAKGAENLSRAPEGVRDEDGRGHLLLARRLDKDDPYCLHPKPAQVNNWDLWFASGLFMIAALAERAWLAPDSAWPRLEWGHYYQVGYALDQARIDRWKVIAIERITTALANQVGPDGDYAEGISYAGYGGQALMTSLLLLDRIEGRNLFTGGVLSLPHWMRNQFIADLDFGVANLNDARIATRPAVSVLACLARRSGDAKAQGYVLEALDSQVDAPDPLLLLSFEPSLPAEPVVLAASTRYQHNGMVIWRTAQDRDGVFFLLQSGAHGGAHQHRDRNTFFLSAYGEYLAVDAGDGRYADPPSYPDHNDTRAHNCLLIDGHGQTGSNDRPVAGRLLEAADDEDISTVLADAGECYPGIAHCLRRVVFLRPDLLVMTDRVDGDCAELTWLLQGYNADGKAEWDCRDGQAVLTRPGARLNLFFVESVARYASGAGTLESDQRGLLRLEAVIPGKRVTTILVPTRPDETPPACARTPDGALHVTFRGKTHVIVPGEAAVAVDGKEYSC